MAIIHFYEKPGCTSNAKQKKLLLAAWNVLIVHDLLNQPWAEERDKLCSFFKSMPVVDWFNRNAPDIKNGNLDPRGLTEEQALDLMVRQPLLIRRPLLEINGQRYAGFDIEQLNSTHDLSISLSESANPESCSHPNREEACQT